jgi:hypothetical protein
MIFTGRGWPAREDTDMRPLLVISAALPILCACVGNSVGTLKPKGEQAGIALLNGVELEGELLWMADSTLYMMSHEKIIPIPFSSIGKICVRGFDTKSGKLFLGSILIAVDVLMLGSMTESGDLGWTAAFTASIALLVYSMVKPSPVGRFDGPFRRDQAESLRPYCRYPAGLTPDQWQKLSERPAPASTGFPASNP